MARYTLVIEDGDTTLGVGVLSGQGPAGPGWTGVTYNDSTGQFVFSSNDGLGYTSNSITAGLDAAVASAEAAQTAAEAAEAQTAALFDQFGDQYLGSHASDPATDNDGDPLTTGDIYWNTTDGKLKFYDGSNWIAPETVAQNAATDAETAQAAAEAAQAAAELAETNAATSETNAATSESNAAASASEAATSESNAASSEANASTSETNAASSASAASTSETNAANSASAASTSETNAAASESAAATSETNAANSASAAAASESAASTSETNAANSASAASTSETNAASSASAAATSETNAAASATEAQGYADSINPDNIDINGGTIDGATIGGTTPADGTFANLTANTSATVNGNITVTGTVDGRDVASDGSKLDGIEANADVTDTTNVTAAGALMDSELTDIAAVKGLDQGVATTDSPEFSNVTATEGTFSRLNIGADLEWNSSTDSYTANTTPSTVTKVHQGMKRCVLNDDGSVNYYLNPTDSTEKLDGTSANLDGTDGNVMVEIPKFYFRQVRDGNSLIWQVSDVPLAGYQLHPAFFKNGEIVDFRYMGAYDACYLDDTDSTYKSGLNQDNTTVDTGADKLASVSGIYPLVGVTRSECRSLAENVGTGWRVQDFWITSAVQMLYLVEYGDFNSQDNLGDGNTNGSYVSSSSNQNDSPHTVAGASNSWGNESTDGSQPSSGAKPGTAYMSYRGIENFFGNCWNWVDGVNVGADSQGDWHVSNDDTDFADNTTTNYKFLVNSMPSDGYVTDIADVVGAFIPSSTGGSSSTYLTDYFFVDNGNTNRVALFGGAADTGARAGALCWSARDSSSFANRGRGARLAY